MPEPVTIQQIAEITGIPNNTVRRYLQTLESRIGEARKVGRGYVYPVEVIVYVRKMNKLYSEGKTTGEVLEQINIPGLEHVPTAEADSEPASTVTDLALFRMDTFNTKLHEMQDYINKISEEKNEKVLAELETVKKQQISIEVKLTKILEQQEEQKKPKPSIWKRLFG
jgi:hypothetical protein